MNVHEETPTVNLHPLRLGVDDREAESAALRQMPLPVFHASAPLAARVGWWGPEVSTPCAVCARPLAQHTLAQLRCCQAADEAQQAAALQQRGEQIERASLILGLTRGRDEARVRQIAQKV